MRKIEAAEAKIMRITDRLAERTHLLDEMELQVKAEFEERARNMALQYERRTGLMNASFSEAENPHRRQMVQLKLIGTEKAKMTRDEYL
jgi:hypothetical protein